MANKLVADFETEFYAFVRKIEKNPELIKQNSVELRRILNKLLLIKNSADLEAIVDNLREAGLFKSRFYHHASTVIEEVETNLFGMARKSMVERTKIRDTTNEINFGKKKTSDRLFKQAHDLIKG